MRNLTLSRRIAAGLLAFAASAALLPVMNSACRGADAGDTVEWAQRYDAAPRDTVERDRTPILSDATRAATAAAIARYRAIVMTGGWPRLPPGPELGLGVEDDAVTVLRRRLVVSGDLDRAAGFAPVFDDYVVAAVQRFQLRHGLNPTGVVTGATRAALDVPADRRLRQLELNLIRLQTYGRDLGSRFVTANLPAAAVETVDSGRVFSRHIAGVGKIDRPSPVMQTRAIDINFNPYWTVPASIVRKDLIPRMQADPNYLAASHIRIFDGRGQDVAPETIDWHSLQALGYRFRQDPGAFNALGLVRINIANPYGVYMHDTPQKGDFGDDERFVSSGCIHMQDVRDYVTWLLAENPGWTRDKVDAAMRSGERIDVTLAKSVPVYWIYITAWAGQDGTVQFRNDIYRRDEGTTAAPRLATTPDPERSPS